MNRYLLLILLTSWSLLVIHSECCDTGVAFTNSVLSATRSSLANADVAVLQSYVAQSVEKCMEDCCSGRYGACSVASYKRNTTKNNCMHFYCRPLKQCKFLFSNSTDSFTFSSEPHASHPVPFNTSTTPATTQKAKSQFEQPHAVEEIATFSDEQADLKNDNTSIKPRKGVTVLTPDAILSRSGIKPRKGVTLEDIPHSKYLLKALNKSNVKPRKGVETYSSNEVSGNISSPVNHDMPLMHYNSSDNATLNDLNSVLAKVFEDDPSADTSATTETTTDRVTPTPSLSTYATSTVGHESSTKIYPSYSARSSHSVEPSFISTPYLVTSSSMLATSSRIVEATPTVKELSSLIIASTVPLLSARAELSMDEPKSLNKPLLNSSEEAENSRKYKSSIHLVLSLVFGLLVLFAVLGVVAKRMYDGWQRRDYYRMNYLIDGIYNGYE